MKPRPIFVLLFLAAALYALFIRFHSAAFLTFYEDDAFYYFQIARNIVTHHGSSFDGLHLTNGYHPLWMLVIVPLMFLAHGKAFFVLLQAVVFLCFAATVFLLRSLFAPSPLANLCAGLLGLGYLLLLRGGMEITLALPLTLALIHYRLRPGFRWTPLQSLLHGLLAALIVLSRLDAVLLIALLYLFDLLPFGKTSSSRHERNEGRTAVVLAIATTLTPLAFYALLNHHYFHTWTTVSSQAKQLRPHHTITLSQIATSLGPINAPYRLLVLFPAAVIFLLFLTTLLKNLSSRPKAEGRSGETRSSTATEAGGATIAALILFPFLQFLAFFLLSDWLIWPWYIYSVPLAATGALLYLLRREPPPLLTATLPITQTALLVITAIYAAACAADRVHSRWYVFAEDLMPFTRTHPGTYAMGDCAGTPAWVTERPFVQLEGLAMDEAFLDNIRHRRNLNDVLRAYNVRYYVTQDATPTPGGCYAADEPYQGGPDSPRMHGTFCTQPVATFPHGPGLRDTLRVFDLQSGDSLPR